MVSRGRMLYARIGSQLWWGPVDVQVAYGSEPLMHAVKAVSTAVLQDSYFPTAFSTCIPIFRPGLHHGSVTRLEPSNL